MPLFYLASHNCHDCIVNAIEKQDLLILDDFGLQDLDTQTRMAFLEIIEDR